MTKRWVKIAIASLSSAAAVAACGSPDSDGLFDPTSGGGGGGGAGGGGSASGGAANGGTSAGMSGGAAAGANSGGAQSSGGRGGAGGTTQGGAAGKTSGGSAGSATGGSGGGKASGGAGGNTSGGSAAGGKAAAGAGGESNGGEGGSGGEGGGAGDCSSCDVNAACVNGSSCVCSSGFVGDGITCARPISCAELHQAEPSLPSGAYTLKPLSAASEFESYCEMVAEGGGFTLTVNAGPAFNPSVTGNAKALGYQANGTNLAYSEVLLASDVMLDVSNSAISSASYSVRVVVSGVHAQTRGHTVRELFSGGPYYLENEDNSNLAVRPNGVGTCNQALENDFAHLVCDSCNGSSANCSSPVIVLGDVDRCNGETPAFAIGGAQNYTTAWGNCAGWPQKPSIGTIRYFPDNFRVWIR